jgi:hypothetical protein
MINRLVHGSLFCLTLLFLLSVSILPNVSASGISEVDVARDFLYEVAKINSSECKVYWSGIVSSSISVSPAKIVEFEDAVLTFPGGNGSAKTFGNSVTIKARILCGEKSLEALFLFTNGVLEWYRLYASGSLNLSNTHSRSSALANELRQYLSRAIEVANTLQKLINVSEGYYAKFAKMIEEAMASGSFSVEDSEGALTIKLKDDPLYYVRVRFEEKVLGVRVPFRAIELEISRDGVVSGFINSISIYQIATIEIRVPRGEALSTAMSYIERYAKKVGVSIVNVSISLVFERDYDGLRGGGPLKLYPVWHIDAKFDRVICCYVFGYAVSMWADTGEVFYAVPQGYYGPSPSDSGRSSVSMILILLLTISISIPLTSLILLRKVVRG